MLEDRWERLKGFSNYHWDPEVDDSKDIKIVTRLENTWTNEIKNLEDLELVTADSFEDMEKHITNDIKLYMQNDITNKKTFKNLNNIGKLLGFEEGYKSNVQVQYTGMNLPLHIDTKDATFTRVIVFLQDWYWGQTMQFGNNYLHNWKAGDVLYWPTKDMPHSTANLSPYSRAILKVSGDPTDKLKDLLQ